MWRCKIEQKNKHEELRTIRRISELADIHFVWQKSLNGLGDAISYARHHVGDKPFAVLLGDTLIESNRPLTLQLMEIFEERHASVVALEEVDRSKVERYGIMGGTAVAKDLYRVEEFVEKPSIAEAPSNLAIAGRYVFTAEIFDYIAGTAPGRNDEIQLTDAMRSMAGERPMYGLRFDGVRYDIGNKLDFLKTNIAFALKRDDIAEGLRAYIKDIAARM